MGGILTSKPRYQHAPPAEPGAHTNSSTSCNGNLSHVDLTTAKSCSTKRDENKNYILEETASGVSNALPLADKRVSIESARTLLSRASSKALTDLITGDNAPNLLRLSKCSFPFENAVFEGGGVKGITYIGAIKVCIAHAFYTKIFYPTLYIWHCKFSLTSLNYINYRT